MSTICLLLFLMTCCSLTMGLNKYRCDYTYKPELNAWVKLHPVPATWTDAHLRCKLEGGNLMSPTDANILKEMESMMTGDIFSGFFTGIHAIFSRGDYHTIEGKPLSNLSGLKWAPSEPNNLNNEERCIVFLSNKLFADKKCDDVYPYVCMTVAPRNKTLNACGTLDDAYQLDRRTGKCYKFHVDARTWERAFMVCAAEGGHLAIPNSNEEADVIKNLINRYPPDSIRGPFSKEAAFLGIHDWNEHGGNFLTIHGETLEEAGFAGWAKGQPDNKDQSCVTMFRSGGLDDNFCLKTYPFVCEKDPKPDDSLLC